MKPLIAISLAVCTLATLAASIPVIDQWERANAYPYGQMCNSIFTGFVDTCPVRP